MTAARLLSCTLALVLAAGCSEGHADHPPAVRLVPAPDPSRVTVHVVRFRSRPYALALGFGSLWVSDTGGLTRVDPATGRVIARVGIPSLGEWSGVATGAGSVWYLDSPGTITRVSPASLAIIGTRRFGAYDGTEGFDNLAASASGVCTDRLGGRGSPAGAVCFAPDLRRPFPVAVPEGLKPIAAQAGRVWIGGRVPVLVRPLSRRVSPAPAIAGAIALAVDGATIWAVTPAGSRSRIVAIRGNHVARSVTTPIRAQTVIGMAAAGGRVWVLHSLPNDRAAIGCISPTGLFQAVATVSDNSLGLVATAHAVWTVDYRDRIATRINY